MALGEGALLLRANKRYSQESSCRITGKVTSGCCDRTIAANFSCDGYKVRMSLHLGQLAGEVILVEHYETAVSGPAIKVYRRKCGG